MPGKIFTLSAAIILFACANAASIGSPFGLIWNSTSPYGQFSGEISLLDVPYGKAIVMEGLGGPQTLSAAFGNDGATLTQICPDAGLIASLVPSDTDTITYYFIWTNDTASLPEGSFTDKFTLDATGGLLQTTFGSGIWNNVAYEGTYVISWVNETTYQNGDVQCFLTTTSTDGITC